MLSRVLRRGAQPAWTRAYATPASDLDAQLRTALKLSMKARDSFRTGVIRVSALAQRSYTS